MRKVRPEEIRPVVDIQRLARSNRVQELAEATALEDQYAKASRSAELEAKAAYGDWQACLSIRAFDPTALAAKAHRLGHCDTHLQKCRLEETRAKERTSQARIRLAEAEAQLSHTEKLLKRVRRRRQQEREEARLHVLEERTTYDWGAR
jgi:hypothetical protein